VVALLEKRARWRRSFRHLRGRRICFGGDVSRQFRVSVGLCVWGKEKREWKRNAGIVFCVFVFLVSGGLVLRLILGLCRLIVLVLDRCLLLTKMVTMGASMPLVREVFSSTVLANAHSSSSGTSASYSSKILTSSLAPKSCRVRDAGNALRRCVTLSTRAAPKCAVSPRIAWGSDLLMVITIRGEKGGIVI
jgi:hypothetical protein